MECQFEENTMEAFFVANPYGDYDKYKNKQNDDEYEIIYNDKENQKSMFLDSYREQEQKKLVLKEFVIEKIYKNNVLKLLHNGYQFSVPELISILSVHCEKKNDYFYAKKLVKSNYLNKSVKKYMLYDDFKNVISDMFENNQNKKDLILNIAENMKKKSIITPEFDFETEYPSKSFIKYVSNNPLSNEKEKLDLFFETEIIFLNNRESIEICDLIFENLSKRNGNPTYVENQILTDKQIAIILKKMCKENNLYYTEKSIIEKVSFIKNYCEETYEEE